MPTAPSKEYIKRLALEVGFDRCGIAPARPIGRESYVRTWLAAGRAGTMDYLGKHVELRLAPGKLLPGARSVIVVAQQYRQPEPAPDVAVPAVPGRIAMYSWGQDYHAIMRERLRRMTDRLRAEFTGDFHVKLCVDTAPLLEREMAAAAGLGWIGKNTLVLDRAWGSYFFLGGLVTTLALEPDDAAVDHCGTCTACLDACPTKAFPAPYEMDASRCISYLTIEHRGEIAPGLRSGIGDWIFGCDVCQEVCPHNRRAPLAREPRFARGRAGLGPRVDAEAVLRWSRDDHEEAVRGTAADRATHAMWRRNADIVARNADGSRAALMSARAGGSG